MNVGSELSDGDALFLTVQAGTVNVVAADLDAAAAFNPIIIGRLIRGDFVVQVSVEIDFRVILRVAEDPIPVEQLLTDGINIDIALRQADFFLVFRQIAAVAAPVDRQAAPFVDITADRAFQLLLGISPRRNQIVEFLFN